MKIIGIESSCDDTSVAIVNSERNVLSNERVSQDNIHQLYKGVVPELAARNHVLHIDKITQKALKKANLSLKDIDGVAATAGPGLIGGLLVGLSFAKTIAQVKGIPFIAVNHLAGHALTARLTENIDFPFLLLLISGGHSCFYFIEGLQSCTNLGGTLDDAVGEAFDKIAKALNLKFPGGPEIEKAALVGDENFFIFPKPLLNKNENNLDLSFSGLKSYIINLIKEKDRDLISKNFIADTAASFQKTVSDILTTKLDRAINLCNKKFPSFSNVVISGGVASNCYLRNKFISTVVSKNKIPIIPPAKLCTDNGAMIAWAGYEKYRLGLTNSLNFKALPRWPLERLLYE